MESGLIQPEKQENTGEYEGGNSDENHVKVIEEDYNQDDEEIRRIQDFQKSKVREILKNETELQQSKSDLGNEPRRNHSTNKSLKSNTIRKSRGKEDLPLVDDRVFNTKQLNDLSLMSNSIKHHSGLTSTRELYKVYQNKRPFRHSKKSGGVTSQRENHRSVDSQNKQSYTALPNINKAQILSDQSTEQLMDKSSCKRMQRLNKNGTEKELPMLPSKENVSREKTMLKGLQNSKLNIGIDESKFKMSASARKHNDGVKSKSPAVIQKSVIQIQILDSPQNSPQDKHKSRQLSQKKNLFSSSLENSNQFASHGQQIISPENSNHRVYFLSDSTQKRKMTLVSPPSNESTSRQQMKDKSNVNVMFSQPLFCKNDNNHSLDSQKEVSTQPRIKTFSKPSKATREKEQQQINQYQREREILRDWIRRNVIEKHKLDEAASNPIYQTPHHTTKKKSNKVRQINDKNTIEQVQIDQKNNNKFSIFKANEDVPDMIVFQNNARDNFFKLAAERKAIKENLWVQNHLQASYFYRVKWDYGDSNFDYSKQQPHQFFNHFPDTRELTTKQGLNKHLNSITEPGVDVSSFYPRCYDLSDQRQLDLYINDFNQTSILNIIQRHKEYFKNLLAQQSPEIQQTLQKNLDESLKDDRVNFNTFTNQKRIKRELSQMQFMKCKQNLFGSINVVLLQLALFYSQDLLNKTVGYDLMNNSYQADEFFKKNVFVPEYKLSDSQIDILHQYGTIAFPLRKKMLQTPGVQKLKKLRGWTPVINVGQSSHYQLDLYLVYLTLKVHAQLEKYWPQYQTVNGYNNVWICKPCYNARGLGIFCFNNKQEIINTFSKKAPTPKVVQKYIERPLLLKNMGHLKEKLDNRKFDIRQWVLVTSIEPLQVYVFKDAYLRICGQHYDISQFDDPLRHLSNYSIQKKEAANTQQQQNQSTEDILNEEEAPQVNQNEFVMSTDNLINKINNTGVYPEYEGQKITWEDTFFPQIKGITKKVFDKMVEVMEHNNNSFELFGLDFVIDEQLKCWLLEANMSPACAVRKGQQWLSTMVENMADGMLNIVEQKILMSMMNQKIEFNGPVQEKINEIKNKTFSLDTTNWELINFNSGLADHNKKLQKSQTVNDKLQSSAKKQKQISKMSATVNHFNFQGSTEYMEVRGKSCNLRVEKKLHRKFQKISAATFIQRVWRGCIVRTLIKQSKQEHLIKMKRSAAAMKLIKFIQSKEQTENIESKQQIKALTSFKQNYWLTRIQTNPDYLMKIFRLQAKLKELFSDKLAKQYHGNNDIQKYNDFLRSSHLEQIEESRRSALHARANSRHMTQSPEYADFNRSQNHSILVREDQSTNSNKSILFMSNLNQSYSSQFKRVDGKHKLINRKSRTKPKYSMFGQHGIKFDPNLLLNYAALGVEMMIPSGGRYFHLQGGMRFKRSNSDNPIEKEDINNGISMLINENEFLQNHTVSKFSPYIGRQLPKRSIYDIYTEGTGRSTMANGFKLKKEKGAAFENRQTSIAQAGVVGSDKKSKEWNTKTKDYASQNKSFTNKAIKQRINDTMKIFDAGSSVNKSDFMQRLNQYSNKSNGNKIQGIASHYGSNGKVASNFQSMIQKQQSTTRTNSNQNHIIKEVAKRGSQSNTKMIWNDKTAEQGVKKDSSPYLLGCQNLPDKNIIRKEVIDSQSRRILQYDGSHSKLEDPSIEGQLSQTRPDDNKTSNNDQSNIYEDAAPNTNYRMYASAKVDQGLDHQEQSSGSKTPERSSSQQAFFRKRQANQTNSQSQQPQRFNNIKPQSSDSNAKKSSSQISNFIGNQRTNPNDVNPKIFQKVLQVKDKIQQGAIANETNFKANKKFCLPPDVARDSKKLYNIQLLNQLYKKRTNNTTLLNKSELGMKVRAQQTKKQQQRDKDIVNLYIFQKNSK